ncbi:MAG: bifunctional diaminohydroxyphosphoribosylaminopyrimidine deaminase/5-amino-6-(5-phosphoribosylamino)uracil reductase RibD [Spartobacteria bacterium]|nr:bifunctional diaminohydroxyphosphoribosylaminopyrimidine deaminase/5-amino-6-(5-phosphoribosylamino)uracil reductase RibD [Spartobacteria bacterium]
MNEADYKWMERALELARRGLGLTRPNPSVGAVVVKGQKLIAEGWHKKAGGLHAEQMALLAAGKAARNATLYVTLEPCSTWGRTPPCTDRIIESGIRRVVVATTDPNPMHAGRGLHLLENAGVEVETGVCAIEADALIKGFACWITRKRPYVSLKLAMSADGKIADRRGRSRWISGPGARIFVQQLRREVDAIMVGSGTAIKDNPGLFPRPAYGRKPYRVIMDSSGRVPLNRKVFTDARTDQTIYVTTERCPARKIKTLQGRGVTVWSLPLQKGRISLAALMSSAHAHGIMRLLCEGGGELAASLINAQLVDEYLLFYSPCIIGGVDSHSSVAGKGRLMGHLSPLQFLSCEQVGRDILVRALPGS